MHVQDISRLCNALGVDADVCTAEYIKLVGVAEEQHRNLRCTNFEAWRAALKRTQRARASYPVTALTPLLAAFGSFTCSSSGVEQNFSVVKALSPKQRNLSVQHEVDQLQIKLAEISESDEARLFKEAAAVWVRLYGKARKSGPVQ